mgnify:CR=1 FL=1
MQCKINHAICTGCLCHLQQRVTSSLLCGTVQLLHILIPNYHDVQVTPKELFPTYSLEVFFWFSWSTTFLTFCVHPSEKFAQLMGCQRMGKGANTNLIQPFSFVRFPGTHTCICESVFCGKCSHVHNSTWGKRMRKELVALHIEWKCR